MYFTETFAQVHNVYRILTALVIIRQLKNNQNVHQPNNKLQYICTMDQIQPLKRMYLSGKISKKLLSEKTNELPSEKPSGKSE